MNSIGSNGSYEYSPMSETEWEALNAHSIVEDTRSTRNYMVDSHTKVGPHDRTYDHRYVDQLRMIAEAFAIQGNTVNEEMTKLKKELEVAQRPLGRKAKDAASYVALCFVKMAKIFKDHVYAFYDWCHRLPPPTQEIIRIVLPSYLFENRGLIQVRN